MCCRKPADEAAAAVHAATAARRTRETAANADSSRSHAVLALAIEAAAREPSGLLSLRTARLNLIDLAGARAQCSALAWTVQALFACGGSMPTASCMMLVRGLLRMPWSGCSVRRHGVARVRSQQLHRKKVDA
jgi:hypothetical protein